MYSKFKKNIISLPCFKISFIENMCLIIKLDLKIFVILKKYYFKISSFFTKIITLQYIYVIYKILD